MSKLSECVEILDSKRIPLSGKERDSHKKIYPYYGAQGIIDYVEDYIFDGNYILVAEDGNNLKSLNENIAIWATGKFWVNNHAHILGKRDGNNLKFIYYLLCTMDLRGFITGSAQPKLNQDNLSKLEMELPSIDIQNKAADSLSTLDNKIANNNKINATFEAMAKTLYDYWFLQFDFPDENGKPYRTSGGKMVWNEELKREIPEGWEVGNIGDYVDIKSEIVDPRKQQNTLFEHYSIPAYDESHYPLMEYGAQINSGKYIVPYNAILYSKLNPLFQRIWLPDCMTDNPICSTEFMVYVPKQIEYRPYIYCVLANNSFQNYLINQASSSTGSRKRVQPEDSLLFPAFIPDRNRLEGFNKMIHPIIEAMIKNFQENQRLVSLRDFILPMLMNGQVTFK
ncbi:MAG: restriction endonuclease subunit S [Selenomonadaceae bacterium]